MYLVTAEEMREMDSRTIASFGLPGRLLMENAGRGAAEFLLDCFPEAARLRIGVVAGRGNNGGDGFVIARWLSHRNISVTVFLLAAPERVGGDAAANLALLAPSGVPVLPIPDPASFKEAKAAMRDQDLWVDAVLGTGLKSTVHGYFKDVIDFINCTEKPVFAVDVPSGLDADTGQPCGACIRAHATATFAFAKPGHFQYPGAELTGKLKIVDIGVPPHIAAEVGPRQILLNGGDIGRYLKPRPPESHKGRTGHLLVVAGAPGTAGAAAMTAMAAMRAGAGLVTLGSPAGLNPTLAAKVLEVMTAPLPETENGRLGMPSLAAIENLLEGKRCLALGPGIGQDRDTRALVLQLIARSSVSLVIDADGLNNLAGATATLRQRQAPTVLTPHPGEMARLTESTVAEVQSDRVSCARRFARDFKVHLVLKGANTVIAHPDGFVFINPTGNPGMASGGMGDVLTGLIAGFLAQGYTPETACHLGVYLHGIAADRLAAQMGPWGFIASQVMDRIPFEIQAAMTGSGTAGPTRRVTP